MNGIESLTSGETNWMALLYTLTVLAVLGRTGFLLFKGKKMRAGIEIGIAVAAALIYLIQPPWWLVVGAVVLAVFPLLWFTDHKKEMGVLGGLCIGIPLVWWLAPSLISGDWVTKIGIIAVLVAAGSLGYGVYINRSKLDKGKTWSKILPNPVAFTAFAVCVFLFGHSLVEWVEGIFTREQAVAVEENTDTTPPVTQTAMDIRCVFSADMADSVDVTAIPVGEQVNFNWLCTNHAGEDWVSSREAPIRFMVQRGMRGDLEGAVVNIDGTEGSMRDPRAGGEGGWDYNVTWVSGTPRPLYYHGVEWFDRPGEYRVKVVFQFPDETRVTAFSGVFTVVAPESDPTPEPEPLAPAATRPTPTPEPEPPAVTPTPEPERPAATRRTAPRPTPTEARPEPTPRRSPRPCTRGNCTLQACGGDFARYQACQ